MNRLFNGFSTDQDGVASQQRCHEAQQIPADAPQAQGTAGRHITFAHKALERHLMPAFVAECLI